MIEVRHRLMLHQRRSPRARDAHLREIHVHEQKRIPGSPDRRRDIAFGVRFKLPEPVREGYSFIDP